MTSDNPESPNEAKIAWYVLRVYPGYEQKTRTNLEERLRNHKLQQPGMQIAIPSEILVEEKERNALSGFILVKMRLYPETWSLVRNAPGVTGFIGLGSDPTPFYTSDWSEIPFRRFLG